MIKDGQLPYERFEKLGPEALTDVELVAIIIRCGTIGADSIQLAEKVMHLHGRDQDGILSLIHVSMHELMQIKGIGQVKAVRLKCVAELSRRISRQHYKKNLCFNNPKSVADYYMESLRHLENEQVLLILTDNRNGLIHEEVMTRGTVNSSLLSPREVFILALKYQAVHIFLLHNHPSGDATPSRQDIELTKHISDISKIINIPLVDHIIIGDNKYTSLKENGLL